jgi:O-antigen/teichoic acid export membrane protein
MNLLGKNISANLLSSVWLTVLMLVLTPLYISLLGVESYGLIGFYLSWVAILGVLDVSVSVTAVNEISWRSSRPEMKRTIPILLKSLEIAYWFIILVAGLGTLMGAWFFGASWFEAKSLSPEVIRGVLMLMSISLVVQIPSGLYIGGLMGLQRQVECSALLATFGTLKGFGSLLILWFISTDLYTFFTWQIVITFLQTGVLRWALWRRIDTSEQLAKFSAKMLLTVKEYVGSIMLIGVLGMIISQTDKMVLSRMVSLEGFGFYMLAWAVVSGFSRITTPLINAFQPQFTELVAIGDESGLAKKLSVASQLMSVLIIPPTAFVMLFSKPILFIWIGSEFTAEGTAPILTIMLLGTMFSSCAFPSLSVLYSRKKLKPVIVLNLIFVIVFIPLLIFFVRYFSTIGAAYVWSIYGIFFYIGCQIIGLRGLPNTTIVSSILKNFFIPLLAAFSIAGISAYCLSEINGNLIFISFFLLSLIIGWIVAFLLCNDLRDVVMRKLIWKM